MTNGWPKRCPECSAEIVFGGTPWADYACKHYTYRVGEKAPWWIRCPGFLRRYFRRKEIRLRGRDAYIDYAKKFDLSKECLPVRFEDLTCSRCCEATYCKYAFDSYNTDGDCLAEK